MERNAKKPMMDPISSGEVAANLRKAAKGWSPGPDGLPIDIWKSMVRGDARSIRVLTGILNAIKTSHGLPVPWVEGCLSIFYKKGDPSLVTNYRPLTIMNADYKLYTSVLLKRLETATAAMFGPAQHASVPGRRISENVKLVQCLIDDVGSDEDDARGVALLFLDQEKGFDRVSHDWLWAVLKKVGIPRGFVHMLQNLYEGGAVRPSANGNVGEPIDVGSGARQGDPLSALLYCLSLEPLLSHLLLY